MLSCVIMFLKKIPTIFIFLAPGRRTETVTATQDHLNAERLRDVLNLRNNLQHDTEFENQSCIHPRYV